MGNPHSMESHVVTQEQFGVSPTWVKNGLKHPLLTLFESEFGYQGVLRFTPNLHQSSEPLLRTLTQSRGGISECVLTRRVRVRVRVRVKNNYFSTVQGDNATSNAHLTLHLCRSRDFSHPAKNWVESSPHLHTHPCLQTSLSHTLTTAYSPKG